MADLKTLVRRLARPVLHEFGVCLPCVHWTGGADHTGIDAYLRCPICRRRTLTHVECERVTPEIVAILRPEWRKGNLSAALSPKNTESEHE